MSQANRRRILLGVGMALMMPAASRAQAPAVKVQAQTDNKVYRIGYVSPSFSAQQQPALGAFRQGLKEAGYIEGRNFALEIRFAEGRAERLPGLIAEVLSSKVDVVLAASTPSALAAKRATKTVPIVFGGVLDPVGSGIVASLARKAGLLLALRGLAETSPALASATQRYFRSG